MLKILVVTFAFVNVVQAQKLNLGYVDEGAFGCGRVGDRSWETYSAEDVKVRVDYVVTCVCDPNDEGCEVITIAQRSLFHVENKDWSLKASQPAVV